MNLAEVRRLKQLLQQDNIGTSIGRLGDQISSGRNILLYVPTTCHLSCSNGNISHDLSPYRIYEVVPNKKWVVYQRTLSYCLLSNSSYHKAKGLCHHITQS